MFERNAQRILIHGLNFFPEPIGVGKYTAELAFFLASRGHDVEVVTAPPHYPNWQVRSPYSAWKYGRERVKGVEVIRCPILTLNGGKGIWRLLAPLSFALLAAPVVFYRILRSRPNVVLCVEPTLFSAPVAMLAAKLVGARTVLHVQDLEIDAAFAVGHLKWQLFQRLASHCEWALNRSFDHVVTISENMRSALLRKGVSSQRISVVRNWIDLHIIYPLRKDESAYRGELAISPETFVVLYSGHLGAKQALDVVIRAAHRLSWRRRLMFVIAGEGPERDRLEKAANGLSNVRFLPLQPAERLNELLALADVHVLPQGRNVADLVLPSKLAGMLASGRPVIAMAEPKTELANLLTGVALVIPPDDEQALTTIIERVSSGIPSNLEHATETLVRTFDADHVLPAFEALLSTSAGSLPPKSLEDVNVTAVVVPRRIGHDLRT